MIQRSGPASVGPSGRLDVSRLDAGCLKHPGPLRPVQLLKASVAGFSSRSFAELFLTLAILVDAPEPREAPVSPFLCLACG